MADDRDPRWDGWLTPSDHYTREIRNPRKDHKEEAADSVHVTFRALAAGETTSLHSMRIDADGGSMTMGDVKIKAVSLSIVAWDLPGPPTEDIIRQLNPGFLEELWYYVSMDGEIPPQRVEGTGPPQNGASAQRTGAEIAVQS